MAKATPRVDWTYVKRGGGQTIFCERCGESVRLKLPMSVRVYCKFLDAFAELHADCVSGAPGKDNSNG